MSLGGSSPIAEICPKQLLIISGSWTDDTYKFNSLGTSQTLVKIIQSDPKGGAAFTDSGAANKLKMDGTLAKLKNYVENATQAADAKSISESTDSLNCEPKKWWQFWK